MKKKLFYLLVLFCGILFCIFLYMVLSTITSKPSPTNSPSGSSAKIEIDAVTEPEPKKGEEISRLIDKTPHVGTFFSLIYNFDDAFFYVYIDAINKTNGNKEFNEFLKQNGIEDKSLITNLKTTTSKAIPEP